MGVWKGWEGGMGSGMGMGVGGGGWVVGRGTGGVCVDG